MFIDIKQKMDNDTVREIISHAVFDDSTEGIFRTIKKYQSTPKLYFYAWEKNSEILGICGYEVYSDKVEIHLISVAEYARGCGVGGAMITALQEKYCIPIEAETDDSAVMFYRKRGFKTTEFIHEEHGRRYTCVLRYKP